MGSSHSLTSCPALARPHRYSVLCRSSSCGDGLPPLPRPPGKGSRKAAPGCAALFTSPRRIRPARQGLGPSPRTAPCTRRADGRFVSCLGRFLGESVGKCGEKAEECHFFCCPTRCVSTSLSPSGLWPLPDFGAQAADSTFPVLLSPSLERFQNILGVSAGRFTLGLLFYFPPAFTSSHSSFLLSGKLGEI